MTRTTDMFTTLRTLDPADLDVDPNNPRARASLEHILTVDPGRPIRTRRRGIRLVAATATVVTAAAALFIVPSLMNGDRAFASWTAAPTGLSAEAAADAGAECRNAHLDGPGMGNTDDLRHADVAIADRRGAWTLVVLADRKGFAALCITDESTTLFRSWFPAQPTRRGGHRSGHRGDRRPRTLGRRGLRRFGRDRRDVPQRRPRRRHGHGLRRTVRALAAWQRTGARKPCRG